MKYSRAHPSPAYQGLMALYQRMHLRGDTAHKIAPEATFQGMSLRDHVVHIRQLAAATKAQSILDYGCGKGMLYHERPFRVAGSDASWESVADYWDVDFVERYDPSYPPYSNLPEGRFDGVICTDVLEHCPEEDMPWIVGELFGYAHRFVFASIAGYPAKKHLPDGSNAHCTIRPREWWEALFNEHARQRPGFLWLARYYERDPSSETISIIDIGNVPEGIALR